MKRFAVILVLCLVLGIICGCSEKDGSNPDFKDIPEGVTVSEDGKTITAVYYANSGTGYYWVATVSEEGLLSCTSDDVILQYDNMPGCQYQEIIKYSVTEGVSGITELSFVLNSPSQEAVRTESFVVTVNENGTATIK